MLDGCHGVGLAFIRSARVVLGSRRRSPPKGLRPQNLSVERQSGDGSRIRLPIRRLERSATPKPARRAPALLDREGNHGAGQQSGFQGRVQTEPGPPGEPRLRLRR
jgi:hypothetical protein